MPRHRAAVAVWASTASSGLARAEPATSQIGFVGLGIMGIAMAINLLKAGYSVTVWNRSPGKCDALAAAGAAVAGTPAEVMSQCDITVAMLADPEAALEVATGKGGIVDGTSPGKAYVDVSTVDAATSRAVAAAIRAKGGLFLEAPVSGSKGPAEQGQLIFLAAGDREVFDAAAPLLDVMGKASFFLGDVGAGAHMKLVVNMMLGSLMASFAEGLALADAAGLSQKDFLEASEREDGKALRPWLCAEPPRRAGRGSAGQRRLAGGTAARGGGTRPQPLPRTRNNDNTSAFFNALARRGGAGAARAGREGGSGTAGRGPGRQLVATAVLNKDLRLVLELGEASGQALPVAAAVHALYDAAQADGHGDADFSAVLEAVHQLGKKQQRKQ
eukprot:scaffold16.g23.t1